MSLILITNHNESIYNISKGIGESKKADQKRDDKQVQKYHSADFYATKYHVNKNFMYKDPKKVKSHGTMGLPKQPLPNPHEFLKKNTGRPPMLPMPTIKSSGTKTKLPPVPTRDMVIREQDEKLKHERKNFLQKNIEKAVKMTAKVPARKICILNTGETRDLSAGLEPRYLNTKVYGKIPPYLDNLIKIKQKLLEMEREHDGIQQPKCIYITREERENLLAGLKANWDELQRVYQGLPILTDTIPKIQRKSKIESDLRQLERDIVLVERHPYIYVYEDENDM